MHSVDKCFKGQVQREVRGPGWHEELVMPGESVISILPLLQTAATAGAPRVLAYFHSSSPKALFFPPLTSPVGMSGRREEQRTASLSLLKKVGLTHESRVTSPG